jgi:hypothetical protein
VSEHRVRTRPLQQALSGIYSGLITLTKVFQVNEKVIILDGWTMECLYTKNDTKFYTRDQIQSLNFYCSHGMMNTKDFFPQRWFYSRWLLNFFTGLKHGWRSGVSARLSPLWPGLDSQNRCHMWVEFVVDSLPCFEGFSPGSPVFLPPQQPAFIRC